MELVAGGFPEFVVDHPVHVVDIPAALTHREGTGVAFRNPDMAAQCFDRGAGDSCFEDNGGGVLFGADSHDVRDWPVLGLRGFVGDRGLGGCGQ